MSSIDILARILSAGCTNERHEKLLAIRDQLKSEVSKRLDLPNVLAWYFGCVIGVHPNAPKDGADFVKDDNRWMERGLASLAKEHVRNHGLETKDYNGITFDDLTPQWYLFVEEKDVSGVQIIHNFESQAEFLGFWMTNS